MKTVVEQVSKSLDIDCISDTFKYGKYKTPYRQCLISTTKYLDCIEIFDNLGYENKKDWESKEKFLYRAKTIDEYKKAMQMIVNSYIYKSFIINTLEKELNQ